MRSFTPLLLISLLIFSGCRENPVAPIPDNIWPSALPVSEGLDPEILNQGFSAAQATGFVDGLLVIRNGFIVAEAYYNNYDQTTPHNIKSVSKSILSALTGIAMREGYIDSLEEKVLDYLPEYIYPEIDPKKYGITIRHLLTMRMGIQGESEENYSVYSRLYNSQNWIKATIESELIADPGERMIYNTFQTHLLSAILTKATGMSMWEFSARHLFTPMEIDLDGWETDPQGYYFGGNSMRITPREMALFGYVFLNNGILFDKQILPEEWVALTLSPSTDFTHPNQWGEFRNYNYAYLWWLGQIHDQDMYMGYGYGGQFLIVFPELTMIVVSTANENVYPSVSNEQEWAIFDIINSFIVPAVTDLYNES